MYSAPIYVVYLCTPSPAVLHGGVLHGSVTDIDAKLSSDQSIIIIVIIVIFIISEQL